LPASLENWLKTRVRDVPGEAALAAAKLLAEGASVPFVARYRKDETGGLDEAALRRVLAAREVHERMEGRRAAIRETAERQRKLTPDLEERLQAATDLPSLEDLFLPLRKKKGPTVAAREAGLEPLSDWIWNTGHGTEAPQEGQTLDLWAFTFRNPEKGVADAEAAIAGAKALLVERLAEDPDLRALVRREVFAQGFVEAVKTDGAKPGSKHEALFGLVEKAAVLREPDHAPRVFALRRGANEGELRLRVTAPPTDPSVKERLLAAFEARAVSLPDSPGAAVLKEAAREALEDHAWQDLGAELLQSIREDADRTAIRALAEGVRRRLLAPPFGPKPVLGLHPTKDGGAFALVDADGRFQSAGRFVLGPEKEEEARSVLLTLAREAAAVAVGDATAARERALFVEETLRAANVSAVVQVVSETAAAAWRTSDAAKEELPDLDPDTRSATALARRLQDPLFEFCRAEARGLAEGPYVHEVSQRLLNRRLEQTVESCLHDVGVDVNRAGAAVLARVAGLGAEGAKSLLEHRRSAGPFTSRAALRSALSDEKSFEQCAGFLFVRGSGHPLDATRVHPERYAALEACAARHAKTAADLLGEASGLLREDKSLAGEIGPRTLADVAAELAAPGRDPRGAFVPFRYRADVRRLEDLKPGMVCPGLVTNTTTFGVFVDLGVPQDGLVHLSQLPAREGATAGEAWLPGDRVEVRVVKVDLEKKQISLSMRGLGARPSGQRTGPARRRVDSRGEVPRDRRPRPTGSTVAPRAASPQTAEPPRPRRPPGEERRGRPPGPSRSTSERPRPGTEKPRLEQDKPRPARGRSNERRPPQDSARSTPPRPAFNNPFAVLAKLKEPKKD
jgi:protein Tex